MLGISLIYLWILPWLVKANTEKIIFTSHSDDFSENVFTTLGGLQLPSISDNNRVVRDQLPVEFTTEKGAFGKQSWYLLDGLEEGRRYEIRVCWAAIVNTLACLV